MFVRNLSSIMALLPFCVAQQPTPINSGETLRKIIQKQQLDNVRESYGIWDDECFTWADLKRWKETNRPQQIAARLKESKDIANIAAAIRLLSEDERNTLFARLQRPLRPTWAQLGEIDKAGQTDAGQFAEKMIADSIVDLVRVLCRRANGSVRQ
jgi:hypothetical protein